MRAFCYCRVSTEEQSIWKLREGTGLCVRGCRVGVEPAQRCRNRGLRLPVGVLTSNL